MNLSPTGMSGVAEFAKAGFPGSYSYPQFRELLQQLLSEDKSTGPKQSEELTAYSRLNEHRMNRWDKHFELSVDLSEKLARIPKGFTWLVITEGWCGDSAQTLPLLYKMAQIGHIDLRIILRDENLWLMDQYLTNGSRSIPVLLCLDSDWREVFCWGPRPASIQQSFISMRHSQDPVYTYDQVKEAIHLLYARNNGQALMEDFGPLVDRMIV
ncbi:MAG: thioredoxin family protein [Flavobacteriales bacterium]|jgi:hypothetical protein